MNVRARTGTRRLGIFAVAATVACVTFRGGGEAQRLAEADWRLSQLSGRAAIPTEVSRRPWLRFATDSGRVTGSGGCNRLTGPFTTERESIRFGAIVSTKMACADPGLNRQEQELFSALSSANRFDVEGDTLVLLSGKDVVARFVH